MILLQNTEQRYGAVARALHWLMAAVLVALLATGLYMVSLPDVGFDTRKIVLILYHKQLGLLALMLAALRLAWRVGSALPTRQASRSAANASASSPSCLWYRISAILRVSKPTSGRLTM